MSLSDMSEYATKSSNIESADEIMRLLELYWQQDMSESRVSPRRTIMSESNLPGFASSPTYNTPSPSITRTPGVIQRPVHDESHRQVERSSSSATSRPLAMTSPLVTSDFTQLTAAEALLGSRRGLARTASEPVSVMDRSMSVLTGVDSMESSTAACRYKTELCRPFEEHGKCKYGDKCQFAHGHNELRSLSRHPKYKTDRCKTYHTTGLCPYGPRCHFIHDDDDEAAITRAHRQQLEEQLRLLKQQHLLEQQRQLQRQQQEQLLITALAQAQAAQQRRQSHLSSDSIASPMKYSARSMQNSPQHGVLSSNSAFSSYPSVCDSLGSIATNSPPSSVSDSPATSPSFSMFNGEELNSLQSSSSSAYSSVFHNRDVFSMADSWQTPSAGFNQSNLPTPSAQYPSTEDSFTYHNSSRTFTDFGYTSPACTGSTLSGPQGDSGPSIENVLLVTELLRALAVNSAGQAALANTLLGSNSFAKGGMDFNEHRFNEAACFSSGGIAL